ncbi:heavy metal translocating P-type ATPase metal-binding domain-containing protein [Telmatospirillum sp. J64-1]|uniref:heavy metal translocating P-type ATPase metal-binding domain-containing protein n=1 Tax=Telmatospirillum sp. J64-1 TaxID=2502183 RepID=UPI00115F5184|nr:heavy metal translocating P-type ATPase metal-binding domain-containing protein [Telmatospirillum sp. J64-1]
MESCQHCGSEVPASSPVGPQFCCRGCAAAHSLLQGVGLSRYYEWRSIDPTVRPLRPDDDALAPDYSVHVRQAENGSAELHLMVEGVHCAACIWLIESLLSRQKGVRSARVNMTTRRLVLRWNPEETTPEEIVAPVLQVGYRLIPYDPAQLGAETIRNEQELLRCMAVAGFAAANVMLLSVSVWAGHFSGMDWATRSLFHWISALIALPATVYCVRPFFRSAVNALRSGRTNMDVPITIGVTLASAMSLFETMRDGPHAYFDSAITLLFFLLVGRYLDSRARGRARSAAEELVGLSAVAVTVLSEDGSRQLLPPHKVEEGMTALVAAGERIGVDGVVIEGASDIDTSLISGETMPGTVRVGDRVFAGTLNLLAPLRIKVSAVGERTLLAEIVRMMETAEQGRAKYIAVADRVARGYAPVVHSLAALTFLGWVMFSTIEWQTALLYAVAVLIITCPCALALAVPVVQVIASGRLMRQGILLKSATALERLALIDTVVFDKTGTLTLGQPELLEDGAWSKEDLAEAAALAMASKHPLARALVRQAPEVAVAANVEEVPGCGLKAGDLRLGSRRWLGVAEDDTAQGPELWFERPNRKPVRFAFQDQLRQDAAEVVSALRKRGLKVELLSGDREATVARVAASLGIERWRAACTPADKCARLAELAAEGRHVFMVGDGLNDAPALAAADVSMSPSTAADVSQNTADVVFQGHRLGPVLEAIEVAEKSGRLVKQNFGLSFLYNVGTIPIAVAGLVTPLIAAIAMSTSSLVVIANAMRLSRRKTL